MKGLKLLAVSIVCAVCASAQTNTGILQITLHRTMLTYSPACQLAHDDTSGVYIHSGVGFTSVTAAWESIVGHWGKRDGLGEMVKVDDSTFTICINIKNYYGQLASPDSLHGGEGLGPLPATATPYNIGCVFRNPGPCPLGGDGKPNCIKGADDACTDIFITDLTLNDPPASTPQVYDYNGNPFPAVEAVYVSSCVTGVKDISYQLISQIVTSPNPFTDHVQISFNMIPDQTRVRAEIYDVLGNKVADFSHSVNSGYNSFAWDGTNMAGRALPGGTYVIKVTNGTQIQTGRIVKR